MAHDHNISLDSVNDVHQLLKPSTEKGDNYLSYLSLSFMLEFALVNAFMMLGIRIGFG